MIETPTISIIMPNFNGDKHIRKAIEYFLKQDYPYKELIIVDGKSTDNSYKIIDELSNNNNEIHWIKEQDKGISDAFNKGIDFSKGEIIGYLGSDDLLHKDILQEIAYHSQWCEFDAIYFDSYTYYYKEKKCILRKCPDLEFSKENLLSYGTIVGWQDIFFKRYIYDKYRYDIKNKYSMDYEFYLRISHEKYFYLYVNKIATINIFDDNISTDQDGKQFLEACEVARKYSEEYYGNIHFSKKRNLNFNIKNSFKRLLKFIV
jgi:glycosyltransferase involved in cell wall biosynthesis